MGRKIKSTHTNGVMGFWTYFLFHFLVLVSIQGCGGGGSVRRRNTLHVVGGRQYIVTSAVYGEREYFIK
jgi:hypothetical protein